METRGNRSRLAASLIAQEIARKGCFWWISFPGRVVLGCLPVHWATACRANAVTGAGWESGYGLAVGRYSGAETPIER